MGRPKGSQEPRVTMSIRVSAKEKEIIKKKAENLQMDPSTYVRKMALEGGSFDTHYHEDRQEMFREVARIGNNVNQIARVANQMCFIHSADVRELTKAFKDMQTRIQYYYSLMNPMRVQTQN